MSLDPQEWQEWLADGIRSHHVPGAALAVTDGVETLVVAAGWLSRRTAVEATPDSIWQIGSITKVFTATQIMRLVGDGRLALDTRVVEILPEFRVADQDVTQQLTVGNLLTHTSGIDGDISIDAGQNDDAISRYVSGLADVGQLHPLGAMLSYCNAGWVIAGRIVEVLTGQTWDRALVDDLVEPLGLRQTVVSPEAALLHRTAVGHVARSGGDPEPVSAWGYSRSWGPANQITASAGDVMAFAQMHLAGGRNADGAGVLLPELVADMQRPRADMENPTRRVDHIGLGWWLCDWGGRTVFGHDGTTAGQTCFLRVDPETNSAVALLTNGRSTATLAANLFQRAFGHLAGITIPLLRPPDTPIEVDSSLAVGVYERRAQQITVMATDSGLRASVKTRYADLAPTEIDLVALSSDAWALQVEPSGPWTAWRFSALADGTRFVHDGLQITPKVQS